jgi:FAD synthetase
MKKIMVFGTFDILHKGHLNKFDQAKKHGDYLIVVVARDDTVKKVKNRKPKHNEKKRQKALKPYADKVLLGYKTDKYKIIEKYRPDIIALGYDQVSFTKDLRKELKKRKLNPKIIKLKPYKSHKYKSSLLRNQSQ